MLQLAPGRQESQSNSLSKIDTERVGRIETPDQFRYSCEGSGISTKTLFTLRLSIWGKTSSKNYTVKPK